ncbi:MAG: dimethylsulfoniopropionate lyase [Neomegalonema sp.]|nr:dimethylsulfoniopropionate lyase [Neomegalonema sp.]
MEEHSAPAEAPLRLSTAPNWVYLLREYYEMYRRSSAGGSSRIRAHQRIVREQISKVMDANPPLIFPQPEQKPVCAHLTRALDRGRLERAATVIRAIECVADRLAWRYGYDRLPKGLAEKFAYAEIAGPNGPVRTADVILGLVLFAPKCIYPTHSHDGVTESYYCLSGAVSENDDGVYAPGSLIFNPPGRDHRITVDAREPCLLAYAWAGPPERLADQKFAFRRAKPARKAGP